MSQASQNTGSQAQDQRHARSASRAEQGRSPAEWIAFGVASVVLLAFIGLILYAWFFIPQVPPVLTIAQLGAIRHANGQFYVPFVIKNDGGRTAEAVQVIAELHANGQLVEDRVQQFAFVAGGETQQGVFVFRQDPRDGDLALYVGS